MVRATLPAAFAAAVSALAAVAPGVASAGGAIRIPARRDMIRCAGVAYLITNTNNGKVYVGITRKPYPSQRWSAHRCSAASGSQTIALVTDALVGGMRRDS